MTIEQMRARRGEIADRMRAILDAADGDPEGSRDLTAEETTEFDGLRAEDQRLEADISRREYAAAQQRLRPLAAVPGSPAQQPGRITTVDRPRFGKLFSFKGEGAVERAYQVGQWFGAIAFNQRKAREYCEANGIPIIYDAGNEAVDSAGGFTVPDQFINDLIDLQGTFGAARQWLGLQPMTSDYATRPRRTGGLTAYAIGENTAPTESQMTFDNVGLTAKTWGVLSRFSSEWSDDSAISVADMLFREAAIAFATVEDNRMVSGTGVAADHGIQGLTSKFGDGSSLAGATDAASTATFAAITETQLAAMMALLPRYALPTASFYCSQQFFSNCFERLAQASGGVTKSEFAEGTRAAYQGYPVRISTEMPNSGTDNEFMVLFGDMSMAATMGTRRNVTITLLRERYADQNQLGIVATERFDINIHDIGDATNAGPLVALMAAA